MGSQENMANEFRKCLDKIEDCKKGYQLITCGPKGCLYASEGFSDSVTDVISCVWNSAGAASRHEVTDGKVLPSDGEFTAIIKKRRKLLLSDKDIGYFASGTMDAGGTDVTQVLLYFRCNRIATFIAASSNLSEIQIVDYPQESDVDPLQATLLDLLRRIPAKEQGKEECNHGGPEGKGDI